MTHSHRLGGQRGFALTLFAVLALAVGGCGDDDSPGDTGDNEDPDAAGTTADASVTPDGGGGDADGGDIDGGDKPTIDAGEDIDAGADVTTVQAIGMGNNVVCAGLSTGLVRCWGANEQGQVGMGIAGDPGEPANQYNHIPTPTDVVNVSAAESLDCGTAHCCAQTAEDSVSCWGWNAAGELGSNDEQFNRPSAGGVMEQESPKVQPSLLDDANQVATGGATNCALKNGGVWCWGFNDRGQAGQDRSTTRIRVARPIAGLTDATRIAMAHAFTGPAKHGCAIRAGGALVCWGENGQGQLGDGTTTSRIDPQPVALLSEVTAVAAGSEHTCAIGRSSEDAEAPPTVYCWGLNNHLQAGSAALPSGQNRPIAVPEITGAIALAAGQAHTCAVLETGRVQCWGEDFAGTLGDGEGPGDRGEPVTVVGPGEEEELTGATTNIVAGVFNTCVTTNGGRQLYCWGGNNRGQLGQGNVGGPDSRRPILVPVIP